MRGALVWVIALTAIGAAPLAAAQGCADRTRMDRGARVCLVVDDADFDCRNAYGKDSIESCELRLSLDVETNYNGNGELDVGYRCVAEVAYEATEAVGSSTSDGELSGVVNTGSRPLLSSQSISFALAYGLFEIQSAEISALRCEITSVKIDD